MVGPSGIMAGLLLVLLALGAPLKPKGGAATLLAPETVASEAAVPKLLDTSSGSAFCASLSHQLPNINSSRCWGRRAAQGRPPLAINAGQGKTGTSSIAGALAMLGLSSMHYKDYMHCADCVGDAPCSSPKPCTKLETTQDFADFWHSLVTLPVERYSSFDYCSIFEPFDAYGDVPMDTFAPFVYAAHGPGTKVILTVRDPATWAERRVGFEEEVTSKWRALYEKLGTEPSGLHPVERDYAPFGPFFEGHANASFDGDEDKLTKATRVKGVHDRSPAAAQLLYLGELALLSCVIPREDLLVVDIAREAQDGPALWHKLAGFVNRSIDGLNVSAFPEFNGNGLNVSAFPEFNGDGMNGDSDQNAVNAASSEAANSAVDFVQAGAETTLAESSLWETVARSVSLRADEVRALYPDPPLSLRWPAGVPPALVINMDRCEIRWSSTSTELSREGIPYARLHDACDAASGDMTQAECSMVKSLNYTITSNHTAGAAGNKTVVTDVCFGSVAGCAISHSRLWAVSLMRWPEAPWQLIVEDKQYYAHGGVRQRLVDVVDEVRRRNDQWMMIFFHPTPTKEEQETSLSLPIDYGPGLVQYHMGGYTGPTLDVGWDNFTYDRYQFMVGGVTANKTLSATFVLSARGLRAAWSRYSSSGFDRAVDHFLFRLCSPGDCYSYYGDDILSHTYPSGTSLVGGWAGEC